jgi:hypothetical protein
MPFSSAYRQGQRIFQLLMAHCSKTVVVPRSEGVILGQIGTTSKSGNPLRNIAK